MMKTIVRIAVTLLLVGVVLSTSPDAVYAYGGPGSVISGIGTLLAAIAALVATLFGFVWFPLKRLYNKLTRDSVEEEESA